MSNVIDLRKQELDARTDAQATSQANKNETFAQKPGAKSKYSSTGAAIGSVLGGGLGGFAGSVFGRKKPRYTAAQSAARSAAQKDLNEQNLRLDQTKNVINSEQDLLSDLQIAEQNTAAVLGADGNLDRIRDDQAVIDSRQAYADSTNLSMQRDQATRQLQGAEGSQSRQLQSALGASGVKGGLAGGAFTDMAQFNLRNRAALEQDLAVQNVSANKERAMFETQLAEFDLGQGEKEKNMRLATKLGLTQFSQSVRQGEANKAATNAIGSAGGGGGTVLCTAMFHHNLISSSSFYSDVEAGKALLKNKKTRKAFLLYTKACAPIANFAIKNKWFALLISPIIIPIAKSFADNNRLGKVLFIILWSPFKLAAKVV